jgi:hypothetical protein
MESSLQCADATTDMYKNGKTLYTFAFHVPLFEYRITIRYIGE